MANKTIENLEQILGQLHSDEAKARVVFDLVRKGKPVPEACVNNTINFYE